MKAYHVATEGDEFNVLIGPNGFRCELGEPEDRTWVRDGSDVVDELNRLHELLQANTFHRDSVAEQKPEQAISCEGRKENGK